MNNTLKSFGKLAMTAVIAFAASVPALAWEYSDFIELGEPTLSQVAFAPSVGSETPDYSSFPYWVGSFHYFFTLKIYGMQIPSDFVVPDEKLAIQVSYSINDQTTWDREIPPLAKFASKNPDWQCLLITYDEEGTEEGINIIPVWKWLLLL